MENLAQIKENIKQILVLMAVNDKLPMDMTELDIDTIFDIAVAAIKADEYLSSDSENEVVDQVYAVYRAYHDEDQTMMIDHVDDVYPAEKFEFTFTVRDFLEQIGLDA